MDAKSFNSTLASKAGIQAKDTAILSDALVSALGQCLAALDSVAIPGFGTFSAVKNDERIESDPVNNSVMLMPPSISTCFTPGAQLRKNAESAAKTK